MRPRQQTTLLCPSVPWVAQAENQGREVSSCSAPKQVSTPGNWGPGRKSVQYALKSPRHQWDREVCDLRLSQPLRTELTDQLAGVTSRALPSRGRAAERLGPCKGLTRRPLLRGLPQGKGAAGHGGHTGKWPWGPFLPVWEPAKGSGWTTVCPSGSAHRAGLAARFAMIWWRWRGGGMASCRFARYHWSILLPYPPGSRTPFQSVIDASWKQPLPWSQGDKYIKTQNVSVPRAAAAPCPATEDGEMSKRSPVSLVYLSLCWDIIHFLSLFQKQQGGEG